MKWKSPYRLRQSDLMGTEADIGAEATGEIGAEGRTEGIAGTGTGDAAAIIRANHEYMY